MCTRLVLSVFALLLLPRVETLERNHPDFDEPTLATVVDGVLYSVANNQYERVREDGSLDPSRLRPPVILRLPLSP